ncbi:hypothetical protein N658DRAFT_85548 [Parathielavia hyrcaniae]|uniref:Uncharacterized protein n=1 Tax=Parathielavia hyrcaniae TaxID=113614 RepID=A0AAN6PZK6_9PEZI|nr:hypothetical protein N658DRAFT_85548 [Parathielavia hyrcaniae]
MGPGRKGLKSAVRQFPGSIWQPNQVVGECTKPSVSLGAHHFPCSCNPGTRPSVFLIPGAPFPPFWCRTDLTSSRGVSSRCGRVVVHVQYNSLGLCRPSGGLRKFEDMALGSPAMSSPRPSRWNGTVRGWISEAAHGRLADERDLMFHADPPFSEPGFRVSGVPNKGGMV